MARMLPNRISPEVTSTAEKRVFSWLEDDPATNDWIVLHSLGLARHEKLLFGEADFVVLAPEYGVFCLEVKGGRVARENGFWQFTNKFGETNQKTRGPFDQARECMFSLMREVRSRLSRDSHIDNLLYGYGAIFPDITFDVESPEYDLQQVWDRPSCQSRPISAFIDCLSEYTQSNQVRVYGENRMRSLPTHHQIRQIADSLRGDFDRPVLLTSQIDEADSSLDRLTKEQFRCLDMFEDNKRLVVEGAAGTGKTVLAAELVRRSFEQGEKVAFFCYNSALATWLEARLDSDVTLGSYVGTFHSFMLSHYSEDESEFDANFFAHLLPNRLAANGSLRNVAFDRIIVDEVQDLLTDNYLSVFDCILKDGLDRGRWDFFGDFAHQAIYQSGKTEEGLLQLLEERATYAKAKLSYNCRNTRSIAIQAKLLVNLESKFYDDAVQGPPVTYRLWCDSEDQVTQLVDTLTDLIRQGVSQNDIVILTPLTPSNSIVSQCELPVAIAQSALADGVRLFSIAAFKGLESSVIIIVDCTSYADFSLYYVGITRAKAKLFIFENRHAKNQRFSLTKEHLNG